MLQNPPKYNMNYISNFLAIRNAAGGTTTTTTLPPSPIQQTQLPNNSIGSDCGLDETQIERLNASTGKSFTIASILGLKKKNATNAMQQSNNLKVKEMNAINLTLNQNYPMHKSAFSSIDPENRLLQNRLTLPFSHHHHHHHLQSSPHMQHHPAAHFNQPNNNNNNNNNNNLHVANHNQTSALQSLQQQFHSKNAQGFSHFHNKEQRNKSEHGGKGKSSLKSKRVRTIFTPEQLERLEAEFERQQYMVGPERLYLAHTLQLTEAQVKVWFQNRRIKWRKHHLEMTQQRLAIIRQHQGPGTTTNANDEINVGNANSDKSSTSNALAASPALTDYESAAGTGVETSGAIDSELSICTDSMDSCSIQDTDDL